MARVIVAAALAATIAAAPAQAKLLHKPGPCPIAWEHVARQRAAVRQLVRCSARHYGVSLSKAEAIAWRESRFNPYAYNRWSGAAGVYQHLVKYWPARARMVARIIPHASPFNARANVLVTMKMVKQGGWQPWGG